MTSSRWKQRCRDSALTRREHCSDRARNLYQLSHIAFSSQRRYSLSGGVLGPRTGFHLLSLLSTSRPARQSQQPRHSVLRIPVGDALPIPIDLGLNQDLGVHYSLVAREPWVPHAALRQGTDSARSRRTRIRVYWRQAGLPAPVKARLESRLGLGPC